MSLVFDEGVGSLEAAAVLAAIARFEEELAAMHAVPRERPIQGAWVMSGRPRQVGSPFVRDAAPRGPSLRSDDD